MDKVLPEGVTLPNYEESILNLSCSVLQHFGVKPKHKTLACADRILAKNPKHVVVILLDGLGMNILESTLYYKDFLRRNLIQDYSSVFPSTTTASTTTFLSGESPIEHGNLCQEIENLPYKSIIDQINETGSAKASAVTPFGPDAPENLDEWADRIRKSCNKPEKTFTYAYWKEPDGILHQKGTKSNDVGKYVTELNEKLTYLCQNCKDTTFFITADHGHKDISNCLLCEDYPDLKEMLVQETSIESRACSFFVKPECIKEFPRVFNDYFGKDYVLFTKKEALDAELFGPGFPNEKLAGVGDFIAAAFKNRTILWDKKSSQFRSHHAGISKEEMRIPLICYEYKPFNVGLTVYYMLIGLFLLAFIIILF